MIISLSGPPGSGKSTSGKQLAERLGWKRYYMGQIRRDKAKEMGMTIEEYNKLGETNPETDRDIDAYVSELGRTEDNFIIESRTAWHFIPDSRKIFIDVSFDEGVERIWRDHQKTGNDRNETTVATKEELAKIIRDRMKSDAERYKKYYGFDAFDKSHFDFIIDSTGRTPEAVTQEILDRLAS